MSARAEARRATSRKWNEDWKRNRWTPSADLHRQYADAASDVWQPIVEALLEGCEYALQSDVGHPLPVEFGEAVRAAQAAIR